MAGDDETVIHLHVQAPAKPAFGAPCNGCGLCCALETCPLARLRFLQKRGPCPALEWAPAERRYVCGMLRAPQRYLPLPPRLVAFLHRRVSRWIAAGSGCDCPAEVVSTAG